MSVNPFDILGSLPDRNDVQAALVRLEQLEAVEQWAKRQLPVGVHDRVTLTGIDASEKRAPGWYAYREALADGATAVVTGVRFATHRGWVVDVELDREWSVSSAPIQGETVRWWNGPGDPPDGYKDGRRGLDDRRHTWALTIEHIERLDGATS